MTHSPSHRSQYHGIISLVTTLEDRKADPGGAAHDGSLVLIIPAITRDPDHQ